MATETVDLQRERHEFPWLLADIPKVTIAAVNGAAVGAGLGLALSCDLCFASDRARFGTAFARVGFGGDFGTTWQLTRRVGPAKAKELFFLADLVAAEEAAQLGLVRSEEHTSELQSHVNLVCRLLLEKKKKKIKKNLILIKKKQKEIQNK